MESALQEMQRQIAETSVEAQLRDVGEMLLADAMTAAGQAMVAGEMEKAAEELSKLELPDLIAAPKKRSMRNFSRFRTVHVKIGRSKA